MKSLQKFILPILILVALLLIYFNYFAPTGELGSFSDFDVNNTASKEIRVEIDHSKPINLSPESQSSSFYVIDGDGVEVLVGGPYPLPNGIEEAQTIILVGHLNQDNFHAHSVELDD